MQKASFFLIMCLSLIFVSSLALAAKTRVSITAFCYMATPEVDLESVPEGISIKACVLEPSVLARYGLAGAVEGDTIELTNMGSNKWRVEFPRTGAKVDLVISPQDYIAPRVVYPQ